MLTSDSVVGGTERRFGSGCSEGTPLRDDQGISAKRGRDVAPAGVRPDVIERFSKPPTACSARHDDLPERAVLCFYADILEAVARTCPKIGEIEVAYGVHEIWGMNQDGCEVAVLRPGVGAPPATAMLEEVIAMGSQSIVTVGGSAIVSPHVTHGDVIVPTTAERDEGTSFHYVPPAAEIDLEHVAVSIVSNSLSDRGVRFTSP